MGFLDRDYLMGSKSGKAIYEEIQDLPIVDLHTHIDPREIAENEGGGDLWELEGATDHYVWELMRRAGIPEEKITGSASNKEKWLALASIFPCLAGNPVYEWIHLDLRRHFQMELLLAPDTGEIIWEQAKEAIEKGTVRPMELLRTNRVEVLCTTDSVLSELEWHRKIQEQHTEVKVLPTWRPDPAMQIETGQWRSFCDQLEKRTDRTVSDLAGFLDALERTHDYFGHHGCLASDHGLAQPWGHHVSQRTAAKIYKKAWHGLSIDDAERRDFHAFMLHFFAELNINAGWVMQLHIGAVRDFRDLLLKSLGQDSGGDVATHDIELVHTVKDFLNEFDDRLPIVIYMLHPSHIYTCATLTRAFPNVFLGAPWWFLDNPYHAANYLREVAAVDLLWRHAGMVTDSRKLISIGSRTEMFRRVLANVLGEMVDQGRIPLEIARDIAKQVAYHNPKSLVKKTLKPQAYVIDEEASDG